MFLKKDLKMQHSAITFSNLVKNFFRFWLMENCFVMQNLDYKASIPPPPYFSDNQQITPIFYVFFYEPAVIKARCARDKKIKACGDKGSLRER